MTSLSVFEKDTGLRSSIKNNLYYVEFPIGMKKYVEAALEHLYIACEEKPDAPELTYSSLGKNTSAKMSYKDFYNNFYDMFRKYEVGLQEINGPDFRMMETIYNNWINDFSNYPAITYCSMLEVDLEKKIKTVRKKTI